MKEQMTVAGDYFCLLPVIPVSDLLRIRYLQVCKLSDLLNINNVVFNRSTDCRRHRE